MKYIKLFKRLFGILTISQALTAMDVPTLTIPDDLPKSGAVVSEKQKQTVEAVKFFGSNFPDYYANPTEAEPYNSEDLVIDYGKWGALNPKANWIISENIIASLDKSNGKLSLWNIKNGQPVASLQASPKQPSALSYHKKDAVAVLAALYNKEACLWDVDNEKLLNSHVLENNGTALLCMGNCAVVGADNGSIEIVNADSKKPATIFKALHSDKINSIKHFKDSKIAIASQDGTATLFDITKKELLLRFQANTPITALACENGSMIITGIQPKATNQKIVIWDVEKKKCVYAHQLKTARHQQVCDSDIREIVPIENGYYAVSVGPAVYIWHPMLNSCIRYLGCENSNIALSSEKTIYMKTSEAGWMYPQFRLIKPIETLAGWTELKCTHYPVIESDDFFVRAMAHLKAEMEKVKANLHGEDISWIIQNIRTRKIPSKRIVEILHEAAKE